MAEAELKELAIEAADAAVDPGLVAIERRLVASAAVDHAGKVAVDPDLVGGLPHGAGEAARDVEALEREDAAALGLDPVEAGIIGRIGHRKDAAGISLEKNLRRDLQRGVGLFGHAVARARRPHAVRTSPRAPATIRSIARVAVR